MKTFWSEKRSIQLSRALVLLFGGLLVALDGAGPWFVKFVCANVILHGGMRFELPLLVCLYLCSIPGYVALVDLYRLLRNLENELVFVPENVTLMRRVSWCCVVVAVVCLVSAFTWLSLFVVALAAALMALIVRIIKNVFVRAIRMKDELDWTI